MRSLKNRHFPRSQKSKPGQTHRKVGRFIRAGKLCRPSSIQGAPAGKGSPHDSAWIMLHCTRNSLNLSKASQFGSTLAGGRPFEGLCIGSSVRAWVRGASSLGLAFLLAFSAACCRFAQCDSLYSSRLLGNGKSLPPEASFRIWGAELLTKGGVVCQQGNRGAVSSGRAAGLIECGVCLADHRYLLR